MIQMEEVVLKKLQYQLTAPTAKTFLRRLLQVSKRQNASPSFSDVLALL